jgi:hypothetical protein
MAQPVAIEIALALIVQPALIRGVSCMPLPAGMTALLEVAAEHPQQAIRAATPASQQPRHLLGEACGFFIEQVMFAEGADSYRTLGCSGDEPRHQLRRHMALLLRWLHPDRMTMSVDDLRIDRTVFAHRVTHAWEDLKTSERRATYDRRILEGSARGRALRTRNGGWPDVFPAPLSLNSVSRSQRRFHAAGMVLADAESPFSSPLDFLRKDA